MVAFVTLSRMRFLFAFHMMQKNENCAEQRRNETIVEQCMGFMDGVLK